MVVRSLSGGQQARNCGIHPLIFQASDCTRTIVVELLRPKPNFS